MLKCAGWDSSDGIFPCRNISIPGFSQCEECIKYARIKKMPGGKYRVVSEKGKNLGESKSRHGAEERLKEVEMFKHLDKKKKRRRRKRAMLWFLLFKS